jgi:hypothetical protein
VENPPQKSGEGSFLQSFREYMGNFHDLLRQKPNLSLHIVGKELNINCLPDDRFHLFEFGG